MLETTLDAAVGDDAVRFELAVANDGDEPVDLAFRSGQRTAIRVHGAGTEAEADAATDADADAAEGAEAVWDSAEGRMFTQALGVETVPAGGSRHFTETWSEPAPGDYRAVGEVTCQEADLRAETTFSVSP